MYSVEDTAQSMFAHKQRSIQSMLMTVREIKSFIDMFRSKIKQKETSQYNFTGQHTDIAFVDQNGAININDIQRIQNEQLRNTTLRNYSDAVKDGYLNFNQGNYTLTDRGREHINSNAFLEQFRKDQLSAMSKNKAQITLTGKQSDLNVFRYVDSININHLAYSDPAEFKRVVSYFEQCDKYGFVNISPDGTVTPTEKCNQFLSQNNNFNFSIKNITPDNIENIAKNTAKTTAQKTTNEAAKKATEEVAKKVTQETVKKATANTSTSTVAASTGVATAGIGAAVTAVVDLSSKGAKVLKKVANTNQRSNTLNHK